MKKKCKIVFFGTPNFAVNVLRGLLKSDIEVLAVVTQPDQPKGRSKKPSPPPVKEFLLTTYPSISLYQPECASSLEFAKILESLKADIFVVAAYGEIIKQNLLDMPSIGCINVHPSLLPKYRGAAPMQRSLMDGVKVSGVAIMHMVKKMDAGDIIKMEQIPVDDKITYGKLEEKLSVLGTQLLISVIDDLSKGIVEGKTQDETKVCFAPKITKEDLKIDWTCSAEEIHNKVRALSPHPGAFSFVEINNNKLRLKIFKTKVIRNKKGRTGEIIYKNEELIVACGSNSLSLLEVQLEGKRVMTIVEFLKGHKIYRLI